ncbi:hypothetical protein Golomagni_06087 [Golovinomyces magnicellulatus]|nr:hypothetical protein Golomagni_06087 [Golovinomyces magnicellulatus]
MQEAETKFNNSSQNPIREIIGNVGDPRNIIQGKRNRKPKAQFHLEIHQNLLKQSAFHAAFQLETRSMKNKIHKSDLPPPPENWHQLKYHPHQNGFVAAARHDSIWPFYFSKVMPIRSKEWDLPQSQSRDVSSVTTN